MAVRTPICSDRAVLISFFTVLAGALAASTLLIERRPELRVWIERLRPFAQVLGVVLFGVGVLRLVVGLMPLLLEAPLLVAVLRLTAIAVQILLGFLLGFELLRNWLFRRHRDAERQSVSIRSRLVRIEEPLGLIALVVGSIEFVTAIFR